jgi:hypothetical protein
MTSKLTNCAVVLAVAISMLAVAGSANAANWHNNKGVTYPSATFNGSFTTNAGTTLLRFGASFGASCATSTAAGTLAGTGTSTGVTGPASGSWTPAGTLTPSSTCLIAGITHTLTCSAGDITAASYNGGTATSYSGAGTKVTTGTIAVSCQFRIGGAAGPVCKDITGTVGFEYKNPTTLGGTLSPLSITADPSADGALTLPLASQALTAANPAGVNCAYPNGAVTIQTTSFTTPTYAVTGTAQPAIWYGSL